MTMYTKRAGIKALYLVNSGNGQDTTLAYHKIRKPSTLKISEINGAKDYMTREYHNMIKFSMEAQSMHAGYAGLSLALNAAKDGCSCQGKLEGDDKIFVFPDPSGCDIEIDITEKESSVKFLVDRAYHYSEGLAQINAFSSNSLTYPTPSYNKPHAGNVLGQLVNIKYGTTRNAASVLIPKEFLDSFKLSMKSKSNKTMFENRIPYMLEISAEINHHGTDILETENTFQYNATTNGFAFEFINGAVTTELWFTPCTLQLTGESELGDEKRLNKIKLSGGIQLSQFTTSNGVITFGE